MRCPLCDREGAVPTWNSIVVFQGREFPYLQCRACRSLYCCPMPGPDVLKAMYGPEYETSFDDEDSTQDPKEPSRVIELLEKTPKGVFLDYGCGGGDLLVEAGSRGWSVLGIEFDESRARATAERTQLECVTRDDDSVGARCADVVHLGDVLEHLVDVDTEMKRILRLLKPGGLLVAQGPLEANANLYTSTLKLKGFLLRRSRIEMAPYHVLLATADGQRTLFRRFGLEETEFLMQEVSWPAPHELRLQHLRSPRHVALYILRKLSQALSRLRPGRFGNRYFYVGQYLGSDPRP